MLKKYVVVILVTGLVNLFLATSAFAGTNTETRAMVAEKVKAGIGKLGTGPGAKVRVKLYDGRKLSGYVREVADDHFVVVDSKTGIATEVPYSNAKQVKGNNLSAGVKIAIGVGVALGLIILLAVLVGRDG